MKDDKHLIRAGWNAGPRRCSGPEKLGATKAGNRAQAASSSPTA